MQKRDDIAKLIHNLRNQLNNISLNADLAEMELLTDAASQSDNEITAPLLDCINAIKGACTNSALIVDNLAEMTSMEESE